MIEKQRDSALTGSTQRPFEDIHTAGGAGSIPASPTNASPTNGGPYLEGVGPLWGHMSVGWRWMRTNLAWPQMGRHDFPAHSSGMPGEPARAWQGVPDGRTAGVGHGDTGESCSRDLLGRRHVREHRQLIAAGGHLRRGRRSTNEHCFSRSGLVTCSPRSDPSSGQRRPRVRTGRCASWSTT